MAIVGGVDAENGARPGRVFRPRPPVWEDAPGGMQRIRVARGWIYRFLWTTDGPGPEQTVALGLTFVPDPEAT